MSARRSDALICRTSWLKNRALLSAARSSRAASRSRAPGRPQHLGRPRGQRRGPPAPAAASSRRKSGSGELRNAATGLPQSTAPAAPPRRSSPSAPHRSSVSSSSSSAPSTTTERRPPQLQPWSQIRGPLHIMSARESAENQHTMKCLAAYVAFIQVVGGPEEESIERLKTCERSPIGEEPVHLGPSEHPFVVSKYEACLGRASSLDVSRSTQVAGPTTAVLPLVRAGVRPHA